MAQGNETDKTKTYHEDGIIDNGKFKSYFVSEDKEKADKNWEQVLIKILTRENKKYNLKS